MLRSMERAFPMVLRIRPGQGIGAHVDCETCFQNTIVTVSLGSSCEMDFVSLESREARSTLLEHGSALVLRDAGRYQWMHRLLETALTTSNQNSSPLPEGAPIYPDDVWQ